MVKRKTIGIPVISNSKNNSGVTNYVINILFALKTLENTKRPNVIIFYNENSIIDIDFFKSSLYQHLSFINLSEIYPKNLIKRIANKLSRLIYNKNVFLNKRIFNTVDFFYPFWDYVIELESVPAEKRFHWLVDFNSYFFPEYYSNANLNFDQDWKNRVVKSKDTIVLSSQASKKEFQDLFPDAQNKIIVLPFSVSIEYKELSKKDLMNQFLINENYFIVPNQFWPHKNHEVVISALLKLIALNHKINVVFTGNINVNRGGENSENTYLDRLRKLVYENGLERNVIFTGHIDRNTQLNLLIHSLAIIQPSFYEGWNTSVEEGKCLNKHVILSDLTVHNEQLNDNCFLFNPNDSEDLVKHMVNIIQKKYIIRDIEYNDEVKKFGYNVYTLDDM